MKIDWNIDYLKKTATCSQITVSIIENIKKKPLFQSIENKIIACRFTKAESDKEYFCLIVDISPEFWKKTKEDSLLLPNYTRQLGDIFNERDFNNPLGSKNKFKKICEICNTPFIGTGKSKYCSNRCKQIKKNSKG